MSQRLADNQAKQIPIEELADRIQDREDLAQFLRALHTTLKEKPDEWDNPDLDSFLEAAAAWVEDMEGYYKGKGEAVPNQPAWKTLARILLAARIYE